MAFPVKNSSTAKQDEAANHPQLRLFSVPTRTSAKPLDLFAAPSQWREAGPDAVKDFSAVAYYFGRDLQRNLNVPIGIIHTSAGATSIEAWSSVEALKTVPGGDRDLANLAEWKELLVEWARYDAEPAYYQKLMAEWYAQNDPGSMIGKGGEPVWAERTMPASDWKTMKLPGSWQKSGLRGFEGVVWFQREFDLPETLRGKDLSLYLGPMDRRDTAWVNGVKVGQSDSNGWVRSYKVATTVLKESNNIVTVRVLGSGGFVGNPEQLMLKDMAGKENSSALSLAGDWRFHEGASLRQATRVPSLRSGNPSIPGALFNGSISPLVPFAIKGAVWYQGESNTNNIAKYSKSLPAMVADWRSRFGVGDFPFIVVQLPGYGQTRAEPLAATTPWTLFREMQATVAKATPHCGVVTTIDLGEPQDVHPRNKQDVGRRAALIAEGLAYGQAIETTGPVFRSMTVDGGRIHAQFDHADGLGSGNSTKLQGFAIAGEDKHFVWADAAIDGTTVILSSAQVPRPVAIRYAWDDTPTGNLTNATHLPAGPFRTDAW